jgi:hypothetical protein
MFCPYCGVGHDDAKTVASTEHIIPYGLGGSDGLTIITCDKSNNELGSAVDAPFMEFFPLQATRYFLGLESTKGNAPTLKMRGIGWINGKEVPMSYLISGETRELKITRPSVVKTPVNDGHEHWQVSGDPRKAREILEGKLRKQMAGGKAITLEDGTALHLEDLDRIFAEKTITTMNPSMLMTIQPDALVTHRFFNKLALAMGHLALGESFSRSATAEIFRRNMNAETVDELTLVGRIWPETEHVQPALDWIAQDDAHTIAVMDGAVPTLMVSLFGKIGAFIPLQAATQVRFPMFSDKGLVWRIALPSRELATMTLPELVAQRLQALREAAIELR